MTTELSIRKWGGTKVQTSEIARRAQAVAARSGMRHKQTDVAARAVRHGWSTFESAPKIDGFEPGAERKAAAVSITPPRRRGKASGASILVTEGEWRVEEQLREERDREL